MTSSNVWDYLACVKRADDVESMEGDNYSVAVNHAYANCCLEMEKLTGLLMIVGLYCRALWSDSVSFLAILFLPPSNSLLVLFL